MYGGGPLSSENGNKLIASGVKLACSYGTTEAGPIANPFEGMDSDAFDPNAKLYEDWQWIGIPSTMNPRFVPQGDGTYELQFLVRSIDLLSSVHQLSLLADLQNSSTEYREPSRCEGLRHVRFVGASSHQERALENVREQ